jgi:hypothetical protein
MNGSLIVNVAIGVVLMYLVVSLFCTVIQEWIAQIWSWRAKNLEAAIIHLLHNGQLTAPADKNSASAEAKAVLDHPLLKMLAPGRKAGITAADDMPSYVPASNFALALTDALGPERVDGKITLETLRAKVGALAGTNPGLHKSLQPILDTAEGELSTAIKGIEAWFGAAMDRASGWYTRNVKWWLLGIAAVLAVLTNADTIQVATRLSADSDLRAAVAAYAATVARSDDQTDERLRELQAALAQNLQASDISSGFGELPLGWGECRTEDGDLSFGACYRASGKDLLSNPAVAVIAKVAGLFLTALAASLGAPFWFGLLQTLNAARGTGPKPASPG